MSILTRYDVWADGHKLRTLGPHTGHMVTDIAYCRDEEMAAEIADCIKIATEAAQLKRSTQ